MSMPMLVPSVYTLQYLDCKYKLLQLMSVRQFKTSMAHFHFFKYEAMDLGYQFINLG